MRSTRSSLTASDAARLMAVVVLPTPPFWFVTAMIFVNLDYVSAFHVERSLPIHKNRASPHGSGTGAFHVKRFSSSGSKPASNEMRSEIKLADSSISENLTARDKAQS